MTTPTTNPAGETMTPGEPPTAAEERLSALARPLSSHPPRVPLREGEPTTLAEMFEQAARERPRADLLNHKRGGEWRSISTEELLRRARHTAYALYALGIRPGERVAILSENCPEWTLTDAGCQFAGVIDVPIYSTQAPPQVCYILNDSGARTLFVQNRAAYDRVADSISGCATVERVVFLLETEEQRDVPQSLTFAQFEERGRALEAERPELIAELRQAIHPDALATIIYTSGTTGEPKGVMLTHTNIVSNLLDVGELLDWDQDDTALSVLPLSHIFERTAMYMYIHHGMRVFYAESIERLGDNMREVRPTLLVAVPRLFEKIYARIKERAAAGGKLKAALLAWAVETGKRWATLKMKGEEIPPLLGLRQEIASRLVFAKWREGMGGRIRMFVSGGAALPEEIGLIFAGAGIPIVQGYGLSETSPVIAANSLRDNRMGTVGRPVRNVEVRIAADGEIETRGPNVMVGYYQKPEATRDVFTADGWFKTGDIGALDETGRLRITDRKKELFKTSGGKYIAPQPIEQRIKQSRFVNQVALIGNGRKFPAALIVPNWDTLRSYAQLKQIDAKTPAEMCRHPRILDLMQRQIDAQCGELSKYERVKKVALLENEFTIEGGEMTPTLKIKRRVVDEKYRSVIDKLYEETAEPSQD
jgi:long-chain acyl-CoA synthetase